MRFSRVRVGNKSYSSKYISSHKKKLSKATNVPQGFIAGKSNKVKKNAKRY